MFSEFSKIIGSIIKLFIGAAVFGLLIGNGVVGLNFDLKPVANAYRSILDVVFKSSPTSEPVQRGYVPRNPNSQANEGVIYHIVKRGETIGSIANKHGSSIQAIIEQNRLEDPYVLIVEQSLLIPASGILVLPNKTDNSKPRHRQLQDRQLLDEQFSFSY